MAYLKDLFAALWFGLCERHGPDEDEDEEEDPINT